MIIGSQIFKNLFVWPIFECFFCSMNFSSNRHVLSVSRLNGKMHGLLKMRLISKLVSVLNVIMGTLITYVHHLLSFNYIIDLISWARKWFRLPSTPAQCVVSSIFIHCLSVMFYQNWFQWHTYRAVIHGFFKRSHLKIHHFRCLLMMMNLLPDVQIKSNI